MSDTDPSQGGTSDDDEQDAGQGSPTQGGANTETSGREDGGPDAFPGA